MKRTLPFVTLLVYFACSKQPNPMATDPIVEALSQMKCVELEFDKAHVLSKVHLDRQEMNIDSVTKTPTETRFLMSCKEEKDGFKIEGISFANQQGQKGFDMLEQHWNDQHRKDITGDPGPVSVEQRKLWELQQQQMNAHTLCDVYLKKMSGTTITAKRIPLEITSVACVL